MSKRFLLLPYWYLLFTIGFGWFILAPLDPAIAAFLKVDPTSILVVVDAYGYAMVALGLVAGAISLKVTVRTALYIAIFLSAVGLLGRALSTDYTEFLVFALLAASAYPLALAPVGSLSASIDRKHSNLIIGMSVGILFIGLAAGSFSGPALLQYLGLRNALLVPVVLGVLAAAVVPIAARDYPKNYSGRNFKGTFRKGMIKNWWIGFTVASLAVMFGGISATVLENLHGYAILESISISGILGGLGFLGSGLGAATVPAIFERINRLKAGLISTAFAALVTVLLLLFSLVFSRIIILMEIGFFFFGFFGNAFWSMSLTSVTFYTEDPAKSGFATSMFSVVSNFGVSIVPVFLGSLFFARSSADYALIIAAGMVVIAALLSPFLIRSRGVPSSGPDN